MSIFDLRSLAALALLATACGPQDDPSETTPDDRPDDEEVEVPDMPLLEVDDAGEVHVARSALDTPMLFSRGYAIGTVIDDQNYLEGFIVYLHEEDDGSLGLYQIAAGEVTPGGDDRQLATFLVTSSDDDTLAFDFNQGMDRAYVSYGLYRWFESSDEIVYGVEDATIERIECADDQLYIVRHVMLEGVIEATVRYTLSPYVFDADFDARENNEVGGVYVNPPVANPAGPEVSRMHKHDTRQTIVFSYTPNHPPERIDDLRIAIDYWNDAFAQAGGPIEAIAIEPLPEGVGMLQPGYHMIEWRDNLEDGTARGINETDPLTGRIIQANITITPVFDWLATELTHQLVVQGHIDRGEAPTGPSEETVQRVVSDYFVNAYTHELGHVLGLRHNFAGNLEATMDPEALSTALEAYMLDGEVPTLQVSSSVMEYVPAEYAFLVGAAIRDGAPVLPYDLATLASMHGPGAEPGAFGMFCEEEYVSTFADCREMDMGTDPIVGNHLEWQRSSASAAFRIAQASADGTPWPDAAIEALIASTYVDQLAALLADDADWLAAVDAFGGEVTDLDAYRSWIRDSQRASLAELDGAEAEVLKGLVERDEANAIPLAAAMRAEVERYAMGLSVTVDSAELDAWLGSFQTALTDGVATHVGTEFVCVDCE